MDSAMLSSEQQPQQMVGTEEIIVQEMPEPKKVIAEKGTGSRLRKIYSTKLDLENTVGAALVSVFVPGLVQYVPAIQKFSKDSRLKIYDTFSNMRRKKKGEPIEVPVDESYLNDEQLGMIGGYVSDRVAQGGRTK